MGAEAKRCPRCHRMHSDPGELCSQCTWHERFRWVFDAVDFLSVPPRWIVLVGILLFIILLLAMPEGCWPNIEPEP